MQTITYETEQEVDAQLEHEAAVAPRIRIRIVGQREGEFEVEAFDPVPPRPGTALLTRFGFGSAVLSAAHRGIIARTAPAIAAAISRIPFTQCIIVDVEGHEDEVGDPARFGRLGLTRALNVARALAARLASLLRRLPASSLRDVDIRVSTAGPRRPIRSNVTEDGRAQNRRVEVRFRAGVCAVFA